MDVVDILIDIVIALLVIAAATLLEPRLGVAAPLLLVAVGIGASLLPFAPEVHVEPEWIIIGVLTPLLYSAAVSMPAMDFRREFAAIGALSVLLVVASALVLGLFFSWVIPGLGLGWGIALGAIVSPTDAVAAPIIKRAGAPARVSTILAGEGLFNDATALVLLRSAVAGASVASVTLWGVVGNFVYAVAVAAAIGYLVGRLNLIVRARIKDATVNTVISFTVPFLAAIPAEQLGASGLVAAGVAGLVTGHGAARVLSPRHRLSDAQNWRTVEFILEGAVFLVMGLQLSAIVGDVRADDAGLATVVEIVAGALLLIILVRAAYVAPLLAALRWQAGRGARAKPHIITMQDRLDDPDAAGTAFDGMRGGGRMPPAEGVDRFRARLRRGLASIDHYLANPLGWREGTVVVWAGMRGVITLAAAQTLPEDTPSRSLLVLIAFLVATGSLLLQGSTLPRLVALVKPVGIDWSAAYDERVRLMALLEQTAAAATAEATAEHGDERPHADHRVELVERRPPADDTKRLTLAVIDSQRQALLDAREDGTFTAGALNAALAALDADQISLELKGAPTDYA